MVNDYPRLKIEIETDPVTLAYAGKTDAQIAALLNSLTTGRTLSRTNITKNEVIAAIRNADYPTTSAPDQIKWNKLNLLLSTDTLDASNQNVRDVFTAIFTGTPTLSALNALATRIVSRAEELNLGGTPTALDVNMAKSGNW